MRTVTLLVIVFLTLLTGGCASQPAAPDTRLEEARVEEERNESHSHKQSHENLHSVLWMQTSAEYAGNTLQLFQQAEDRLGELLSSGGLTADLEQAAAYDCEAGRHCQALADAGLKPAVVLDVDETVLDNSPYQARLILAGTGFAPDTWDAWVAERSARAIPGAVSFIRAAREAGVAVIYITNRRCASRSAGGEACPQKTDTAANLVAAGFPEPGPHDRLILRADRPEWDASEKKARREAIARDYRILMLVGDDLGDLASDIKTGSMEQRADFVNQYAAMYGRHWFQLSNPTYGSWTRALSSEKTFNLRED